MFPYQPAGIWEALNQNTAYRQSKGDSLYRRSLYTVWKRTSPPPMMLNFDAAERHSCTVKRQKTSTPLQALVTLNDPQFVEAARVLAQGVLAEMIENPNSTSAAINRMVKAIISRPARASELNLLEKLYIDELLSFQDEPKRAAALLSVGEYPVDKQVDASSLAAMTVVASTLMNMDEALIKR